MAKDFVGTGGPVDSAGGAARSAAGRTISGMSRGVVATLNEEDLAGALAQLMTARTDTAYLIDRSGRIIAESPAGAIFRNQAPALPRLLLQQAAHAPKRSAYHSVPGLGVSIMLQACVGGGSNGPLLVTVSRLDHPPQRAITLRQRQLLALLRAGLRNAEIAARMRIQPSTVKTMLERLYRLAGVPNRQALARWAGEQPTS